MSEAIGPLERPPAGALSGFTVLDISQMIAGPVGCSLLADMGAEVIKVEPIDGESTRHTVETVPHEGISFVVFNRGKRGIPVDLTRPEGREIVRRLVARADAAVVGYRPDVCERFELTYEALAKENPRLVYLQNTAFGSSGPLADLGGYDLMVQGISGLMAMNQGVTADGQPRSIAPAFADYITAALVAWAVTAGLLERERSGKGQKIETALLASALTAGLGRIRYFPSIDAEPTASFLDKLRALRAEQRPWSDQLALRGEERSPAGNIYYRAYATADSYVLVACINNPTRVKFLRLLGLEDPRMNGGRLDVTTTPDQSLRAQLQELAAEAEQVMAARTSGEWLELFAKHRIPSGPLQFPEEVFDDEQVLANGFLETVGHPLLGRYTTVAPPVRMERTPLAIRSTAPLFGEHTRDILAELGYNAKQIEDLVASGAVAAR
jgi:formyl-CoA transferase